MIEHHWGGIARDCSPGHTFTIGFHGGVNSEIRVIQSKKHTTQKPTKPDGQSRQQHLSMSKILDKDIHDKTGKPNSYRLTIKH